MVDFWNERYGQEAYVYGVEPNRFFEEVLTTRIRKPGKILLPAEGEGRNAVFAATLGWDVEAFDISEAGRMKAHQLATDWHVSINYEVADFDQKDIPPASFDAVGLIYAHFHEDVRPYYFRKVFEALKPGGIVVMELFSKNHLAFNMVNPEAGGPKDQALLVSVEDVANEFSGLKIHQLEEVEIELAEGLYHRGRSAVIRFIGEKL